jgi:hypothetical protein
MTLSFGFVFVFQQNHQPRLRWTIPLNSEELDRSTIGTYTILLYSTHVRPKWRGQTKFLSRQYRNYSSHTLKKSTLYQRFSMYLSLSRHSDESNNALSLSVCVWRTKSHRSVQCTPIRPSIGCATTTTIGYWYAWHSI